jgi:hypothetical protein
MPDNVPISFGEDGDEEVKDWRSEEARAERSKKEATIV